MALTPEFERFLASDHARHVAIFGMGGLGATGPEWATDLYRNGQESAAIDAVAAFTSQPRDLFVGNMAVRNIDPNVTGFDPSRVTSMGVDDGRLVPGTRELEVTIGGCLPYGLSTSNLKQILGLRGVRYKEMGRASTFSMYGALRSISGLPLSWVDLLQRVDPTLIGCSIGCGIGNMDRLETMFASQFFPTVSPGKDAEIAAIRALYANLFMDPTRITAKTLADAIGNAPGGYVAMDLHLKGILEALTTACAVTGSSVHSLWKSIVIGMLRAGFAGGVEAPLSFAAYVGFIINTALIWNKYLREHNLQPHQAPRPFDLWRDGFVLAEGGAIFFLGDAEWGMSYLGLKPLAIVGGVASHGDGYATSATEPGEGIRLCYDDVFRITGLRYQVGIDDYDAYGAHATSTKQNDINESGHFSRFLSENGYSGSGVHIFSTQDTEGHRIAGSGGASMIAGIQSMSSGFFPGLRNLDQIDPAIAAFPHLRIQRDGSRVATPRAVMTGTLGFFHKNVATSLLNPTVYGPRIFGDDYWKDKERLWREQEEAAARREEDVRTGRIKLATFIPPAPKR